MACVNPDGTVSPSARALLEIAGEPLTPAEIAGKIGRPLFQVRSSIRELVEAGLLREEEGKYSVTRRGRKKSEAELPPRDLRGE